MPFFVEDFRWTSQNFRSMAARGAELRRWWRLAQPFRELLGNGAEELPTVEEPVDGREVMGCWKVECGKRVEHVSSSMFCRVYE